jgi:hypothetical protein
MTSTQTAPNPTQILSTPTSNIYIPPGTLSLTDPNYKGQLRVGIQGPSGTGKSVAAATFPNPIFLSYDRGLSFLVGRDVKEIPFYSDRFIHYINGENNPDANPFVNRKEALTKWIENHGRKLISEQSLIFDANSGIQAAYHQWWEYVKMDKENLSQSGAVDARREWRLKLNYYTELMLLIKELKCNVLWLWHESPDRDDKGNITGEVRPLISG